MKTNGDLYYSIHKATIHIEGYRDNDGTWVIHSTLSDTYDFIEVTTFMDADGGFSAQAGMGTMANDIAFRSQLSGAIKPYKITVDFYTRRKI